MICELIIANIVIMCTVCKLLYVNLKWMGPIHLRFCSYFCNNWRNSITDWITRTRLSDARNAIFIVHFKQITATNYAFGSYYGHIKGIRPNRSEWSAWNILFVDFLLFRCKYDEAPVLKHIWIWWHPSSSYHYFPCADVKLSKMMIFQSCELHD